MCCHVVNGLVCHFRRTRRRSPPNVPLGSSAFNTVETVVWGCLLYSVVWRSHTVYNQMVTATNRRLKSITTRGTQGLVRQQRGGPPLAKRSLSLSILSSTRSQGDQLGFNFERHAN